MKIINALFSIFCHQYADRSSHYYGEVFPVCDRCAGLYFGIFSSYLFILILKNGTYFYLNKNKGLFLTLLLLPFCIDGVCNHFSIWSSTGAMRALTGMLCGISLPLFLISIRNSSLEPGLLGKLNSFYLIVPLSTSSSFILLLIFIPSFFAFYTLAIIAASGMLLFFSNMLITFFKVIARNRLTISRY